MNLIDFTIPVLVIRCKLLNLILDTNTKKIGFIESVLKFQIDREIGKKTDRGTKQSIEDVKNLTKKFYFQPGIYDD